MEQKKKYMLIALIGATLFSLLILINFNLNNTDKLEMVENITLTVDYNNGTIKTQENFTLSGGKTTAFDALNQWCEIQYAVYGNRYFVIAIDGIGGDWLYFINGNLAGEGSNVYALNNGDLVEWRRS